MKVTLKSKNRIFFTAYTPDLINASCPFGTRFNNYFRMTWWRTLMCRRHLRWDWGSWRLSWTCCPCSPRWPIPGAARSPAWWYNLWLLSTWHAVVELLVLAVVQDLQIGVQLDDGLDDPDQRQVSQIVHVEALLQLELVVVHVTELLRDAPHKQKRVPDVLVSRTKVQVDLVMHHLSDRVHEKHHILLQHLNKDGYII